MTDTRSSSALFKRAEQLRRWEESDTNKQSPTPKRASRIQFSSGIVFLAACTSGDKDEVQRLLKAGADINTANVDGLTALHQACIDDNLDMVEFLVAHGADVNRGDNEGWTPLHATASCGFLSIARYLLESGADVAAVNYDGELAVDIAESDAMEQLLQKAIDEKGIDCEKSRNAEVDNLLSDAKNWAANGYVEVRDPKTGGTPLHVAAAKGYIDVAKMLLEECGAEPDCVDYEGWTPLHAAALWGQKEAAALLLKCGADPHLKNYSGQTCMDLVDPSISSWLADATLKAPRRVNNNNNKRKLSPPRHEVKRVELQITGDVVNDKPPAPEIIKDSKPPKGRAPSPDAEEEAPSWRRTASFRKQEVTRENKPANNAVDNDTILRRTHSFENDKTFYQRYRDVTARIKASSCPSIPPPPLAEKETNDTNEDVQTRINSTAEKRERDANTWSPTSTAANTNTTNTNTTTQTTVRRSFVPPVRDEESETQRKAHAKRVRETRRSTQGVTLDEIKSAEQLVKKKTGNGTTESPAPASPKKEEAPSPAPVENNSFELEDAGRPRSTDATVTLPLRRPPAASTANTASPPSKEESRAGEDEKERESSSESKSSSNASPASTQAAMNVIQRRRRPKRRSTGVGHVDMDDIVNDRGGGGEGDGETETVQVMVSRARHRRRGRLVGGSPSPASVASARLSHADMSRKQDRYSSRPRSLTTHYASSPSVLGSMFSSPSQYNPYSNYSNYGSNTYRNYNPYSPGFQRNNPAIYGGTSSGYGGVYLSGALLGSLNIMTPVLKKLDKKLKDSKTNFKPKAVPPAKVPEPHEEVPPVRPERRPRSASRTNLDKERSRSLTAIEPGGYLNARTLSLNSLASDGYCSGSERTEDGEDIDYKALYIASSSEVRRLRALLATSEQQLRDARATIARTSQVNQNSLSDIEKREKRAMERKLSEMEEELKQLQKLKAENERLRAENRALTRVVSKLTNSATK